MNQLLGQQDAYGKRSCAVININVDASLQNLTLQISIDPECPFNEFIKGIEDQILSPTTNGEGKKREYQLGNGTYLSYNENRTLEQLGFTNNCILYMGYRFMEYNEPTINIICQYREFKIKLKLPFDSTKIFCVFLEQILSEHIFDDDIPIEFKNNIECKLGWEMIINQNETKSLDALGFTKNCTLNIKLSNREDEILTLQQKRIFKVLVDLQFQKIELNISQYKNTPVSCVFNDILMELIESQQFSASQLLAFFINDKEIDPFDCRLLEDFYILKSIKLKKIPSNKQPNQYANEKNQFALKNKSKWQRLNLEEKIKIECVDDNIEILALINHSLEDIIKQIISDLSISKKYQNYSVKYQINGEELQDIYSIYSKTDIQIKIQYPQQQNVLNPQLIFQFTGDFYQKILISGQINSKNFIIEESLEINGSYDQLLEYLKFKIFGPQEKQYSQDILDIKSRFIKVNYIQKRIKP